MNTPLTDAVDAASYPDPSAHREALRKLCRELEAENKLAESCFHEQREEIAALKTRLRAVTEAAPLMAGCNDMAERQRLYDSARSGEVPSADDITAVRGGSDAPHTFEDRPKPGVVRRAFAAVNERLNQDAACAQAGKE